MQKSDMKNIVVLKNLPSNIVDEAIVILKETKKIKNVEIAKAKNELVGETEDKISQGYILKEAENLIQNYAINIEKEKEAKYDRENLNKRYKVLKLYSIVSTMALFVSLIIILI